MAKSDGTIIIDTLIDTSGFGKSATNLKSQFGGIASAAKKLGAAIGLAFSVTAVIQFGKESSKTAMQLSDALTGLQSIVEGQGRSFSKAQAFIEEYTKDGLIPATNAITAYKNLAMRGYDDSQIRQVMVALKDASAYGRQASYSMGEAVQSASEGLKNENSILVDNAGVTKNVAKMWEDYAKSIGTTANNLTQQQKIQAEVTGILEESKYQTGDAAKVASTLSGKLSQLSYNFNELKVAVGNVINPIVNALLPVINSVITAVTSVVNTLASASALLFGEAVSVSSYASAVEAAADAEEDLADGISGASKAAKKALAGFDELNILQEQSSKSTTGGYISYTTTVDVASIGSVTDATEKVENATNVFEKFFYEVLGEVSVRNIENFSASLNNLSSGWQNLVSSVGSTEIPFTEIVANSMDTWLLSTAGQQKMLGGLLDLIAEYRKNLDELAPGEWVDTFSFITSSVLNDKDIWDALGEMYSGLGMAMSAYMPESGIGGISKEEWENLFLPVTEEYVNLYKDLSTEAAAALRDYQSIYKKLNTKIKKIDWSSFAITEKDVEEVKTLTDELFDTIVKGNEEARQAAEDSIASLLADGLISEEDAKRALQNLDETYKSQEQLVEKNQAEILGILEKAKKEQRTLTAEENQKIEALLSESNEKNIAVISQGASDSTEIYAMLAENRGKISKQMLSQAIQYANDEYAATVKAAEDTYAASIANADKLYYDLGVIDAEEYQRIKKEAEDKKNVQISNATEAKEKLIAEAQAAAGGIADAVDPETGEIKSNWEILWDDMFTKVKDTWEDIKEKCKEYINKIIKFINAPIEKINSMASTIGGQNLFGVTVPSFSVPTIPYLAKGAVIPPNAPFMAVLGDQRHGMNIEAPESTIRGIFQEEISDMIGGMMAGNEATVAKLQEILETVREIEVGDTVIGEAANRYNRKMAIVKGGSY